MMLEKEGKRLHLIISNNSEIPIYQQIKDQIKDEILRGELSDGEMLPSIRGLANEINVSVLTTKRAYDELVAEGFIHAIQGKGFFVAVKNLDVLKEGKMKEIEEKLQEAIALSDMIGLAGKELMTMLEILLEDKI